MMMNDEKDPYNDRQSWFERISNQFTRAFVRMIGSRDEVGLEIGKGYAFRWDGKSDIDNWFFILKKPEPMYFYGFGMSPDMECNTDGLRLYKGYSMKNVKELNEHQLRCVFDKYSAGKGTTKMVGNIWVTEINRAKYRYPMRKDQPAQIDCRMNRCKYHIDGACTNISPAITLNDGGTFVCWSAEGKPQPSPIKTT